MVFLRPNMNAEKTHKANISRRQPPLLFCANIIVYSRKMLKKKPTKQAWKVNVRIKQKTNEKNKKLKDK